MVEDTLWVMGGADENNVIQQRTQVVRQGQSTQWGPDLTEFGAYHCATTLQDNSVILTGGARHGDGFGSARTEVYNSTTRGWERKADMRYRRYGHSCTNVWLEPKPSFPFAGAVIADSVYDRSVLSVVVAGGKMILYITAHSMSQEPTLMRKEGSAVYTVRRCTCPGTTPGWNCLPSLSLMIKTKTWVNCTIAAYSHSIRKAC